MIEKDNNIGLGEINVNLIKSRGGYRTVLQWGKINNYNIFPEKSFIFIFFYNCFLVFIYYTFYKISSKHGSQSLHLIQTIDTNKAEFSTTPYFYIANPT